MNTEDFTTYKQAVKLKECGFDWPCTTYLNPKSYGKRVVIAWQKITVEECVPPNVLCPSLSQAAKWLREVKGIDIEIRIWLVDKDREYRPYIMPPKCNDFIAFPPEKQYESALSAGIDAALELITTEKL